jgi:hypothetical protein
MTSDRQLRRWYNAFNRQWFGDKLPRDTVLLYEVVNGSQAECVEEICGRHIIRINPAIAWSSRNARFALIHEMAHIKVGNEHGHGKKFQDEMLRLAQIGALRNLW